MDISYFQKINNAYKSSSKQETELYLLNKHVTDRFADSIDYHVVKRNGEPFELLIIKDTDGNTFKKKIKAKHDTPFNLGDYIEWNSQHWLVTLLDPDEKAYHSGYMYLCTVPLRWQNSNGEVIERYAYSEDFTKYSSGTSSNNTITIGDNQYGLTLPIDVETKKLNRDMRFPIDFDDSEQPDIYKLTNRKVNLNNNTYFGRGGTMVLTMSFDSFNKDDDKLVDFNEKQVWICNYHSPTTPPIDPTDTPETDETAVLSASISGKPELKLGISRTYTVTFTDKDGVEVTDVEFAWNVVSDFAVEQVVEGNTTELYVNDDTVIGESFILQVLISDSVVVEIEIAVVDMF